MYEFIDRPVARLGGGSRFLLWAMRTWVNAGRRGLCPRATVAGSFVNMGAAAALPDFADAMLRLSRAPGEPLVFGALAAKSIAEGEALMLSLWADLVKGKHELVVTALRLVVPAATADLLVESMAAASDHLCHAGLVPSGLVGSDERVGDGNR